MEGMNPIAAIVQPSAIKPPVFVGLASALCALTGSIIALRLWTNFTHNRKLHVDDYLSVLALLFLIWNSVTFSMLFDVLNSNPNDVTIEHLTRLVAVGIASGNSAIYSAKLPLLFMLIRIFGIKDWLRWMCICLIVVGTLGGVITLLYAGISCSPDLHEPTPPFLFSCVGALTNATIARGSISLAIDVIAFVVPIPIIVNLKMPLRRKIGVAFVFATGLLAIAASALGLYFQKAQSEESSTNFANALLVTVIESAVVLMVSCTPAIHVFWTKHAGFLRSSFGLLTSSHTKSKLSESKTNLGATTSSNSDRTQVHAHEYVELEEHTYMGKPPYESEVLRVKQYV
ncbi:hypothetical protein N7471_006134 [Penicillium samsonianum]|uniref:uncharacterized protein n=1 Tax=Penicillium samsonianum TaxID=1882272 RepID=UPI002548E71B|nr:uncharacterized protein N7471_006134 [Penicillium samsonianum]KAJ6139648.1 hypothetical protein N7471_006134 [Penicillium samsonianum]